MGVVISAVGTATPEKLRSHGARRLANSALRACLERSPYRSEDIDVLINAGVYREKGLGEPALAALIQEDVKINPDQSNGSSHGTFSFDIANGACGVLTGVDLARGFLESGAARLVAVVASDSGANPLQHLHMPYSESGGALLLARVPGTEGFVDIQFATFPEYAELAQGYWAWTPHHRHRPGGPAGSNRLTVFERDGFRTRAAECAAPVVARLLERNELAASDVGLLVATPEPSFADLLADRLGIVHTRVTHVGETFAQFHSAQPVAAITTAMRIGEWERARTILLVAAGAGITVGAALYRH